MTDLEETRAYLSALERSVQYQLALGATPLALTVANLGFLAEVDGLLVKILLTLGVFFGLSATVVCGALLATAKSFNAHLLNPEKRDDVEAAMWSVLAWTDRHGVWVLIALVAEYCFFSIGIVFLIWQ